MRDPYPTIEPYRTHRLRVDAIHDLYIEECGNPDGSPVVYLHGGPGAGISPNHRRLFDPTRYRIVLFDQRGAGRSTPHGELRANTTWDLVGDIETIRKHLRIDRWQVFGGSWGSALALAYAQANPERVTGLVLRGIFLGRPQELRWFNELDGGAQWIFPERWSRYLAHIPIEERADMLHAYGRRLDSDDATIRLAAARAWNAWGGGSATLLHDPASQDDTEQPDRAIGMARLEVHYFRHGCFFEPDQLLRDIDRIRHIAATIVQGRYDIICPVRSAFDLAGAWPEADLKIVLAGHSVMDPAIVDALVSVADAMATPTT